MATRSKPPRDLLEHRRILYPTPTGTRWQIGCRCGWRAHVELTGRPVASYRDVHPDLDRQFIEHVPADRRRLYVEIDARPVPDPRDPEGEATMPAGSWIMPESIPCRYSGHYEDDGVRYVRIVEPIEATMPVGEIWTADGRNFRFDTR